MTTNSVKEKDVRTAIRYRFKELIAEAYSKQSMLSIELMHKIIQRAKKELEEHFEDLLFKPEYEFTEHEFTEHEIKLSYWFEGNFNSIEVLI